MDETLTVMHQAVGLRQADRAVDRRDGGGRPEFRRVNGYREIPILIPTLMANAESVEAGKRVAKSSGRAPPKFNGDRDILASDLLQTDDEVFKNVLSVPMSPHFVATMNSSLMPWKALPKPLASLDRARRIEDVDPGNEGQSQCLPDILVGSLLPNRSQPGISHPQA
jgi:hypothetical protein